METVPVTQRASALWLVRIVAAFAAVELAAVQLLAIDGLATHLIVAAVLFDAALLVAVSYWLLARPHGGFRALPFAPRDLLTGLVIALGAHRVIAMFASVPSLGSSYLWIALGVEAAIGFSVLLLIVRTARRREGSLADAIQQRFDETLPKPVASLAGAELRIWSAAFAALTRKQIPNTEGYSVLETSTYRSLAPALIVLSTVEAPAIHLLVQALAGEKAPVLHAVLVAVYVYTLLWIVGDLRLLREAHHRLEPDGLRIDFGLRVRGLVPYDTIAEIRTVALTEKRDQVRVTPFEAPNQVLLLDRLVELELLMGRKKATDCIALYVDDPMRLSAALRARAGK